MAEDRLPRRVRVYLHVVSLLGVLALGVFAWISDAAQLLGPTPGVVVALTVGLVLAEIAPSALLSREDTIITLSWVFSFAVMLAGAPVAAVVCAAVVSLLADLHKGASFERSSFNASQVALSLLGGYAVLEVVGIERSLFEGAALGLTWFLGVFCAGAVVFVLNASFVGAAVSMATGQALFETLKASVRISMSTDGLLLSLAPVFVVVGQRSLPLLPLIGLTVLAVFRTARAAESHERDAQHDELTGLQNRRAFIERGTVAVEHALSLRRPVVVMLIDLDGFKSVNDTYGHSAGDELLGQISGRLGEPLAGVAMVARLGGDEFAVLTEAGIGAGEAVDLATELRQRLLAPFELQAATVQVGGSFGLASAPTNGSDLLEVLAAADAAMYEAKRSDLGVFVARARQGRAGGVTSNPSVVAEMERALSKGEMGLNFQPRVDLVSGAIVGVEALMRWRSGDGRVELPTAFRSELERSDLTHVLTRSVLDMSLGQVARWDAEGIVTSVSVNLAHRALSGGGVVDAAGVSLAKHGVAPSRLDLEITESSLIGGDFAASRLTLAEFRRLGVRVVLDDFGTGMSSLTGLLIAELDAVKVDSSIIAKIDSDSTHRSVVASIVDLGARIGIDVVAEGVSSRPVLETLLELGCAQGQGHLICRPLPADEVAPLLRCGHLSLEPAEAEGLDLDPASKR